MDHIHFPFISNNTGLYYFLIQGLMGTMPASVVLAPEVTRILLVRNLPFEVTSEDMYGLFGKYGAIFQIRLGNSQETRGTALVVYENIHDSKSACEHLNGFQIQNRYITVVYYQPHKQTKRIDPQKKKAELEALKLKYNIIDE
jgi:pre-mRNA branch site protein p14